jgi:hypothetical protein
MTQSTSDRPDPLRDERSDLFHLVQRGTLGGGSSGCLVYEDGTG